MQRLLSDRFKSFAATTKRPRRGPRRMDYTAILGESPQCCFDATSHFLQDRLVWQLLLLRYARFCHMTPCSPVTAPSVSGEFGQQTAAFTPQWLASVTTPSLKMFSRENSSHQNVSQIHRISLVFSFQSRNEHYLRNRKDVEGY